MTYLIVHSDMPFRILRNENGGFLVQERRQRTWHNVGSSTGCLRNALIKISRLKGERDTQETVAYWSRFYGAG